MTITSSISKNGFKHQVKLKLSNNVNYNNHQYQSLEIITKLTACAKWCNANCPGEWTSFEGTFYFNNESQALMFALVCG